MYKHLKAEILISLKRILTRWTFYELDDEVYDWNVWQLLFSFMCVD